MSSEPAWRATIGIVAPSGYAPEPAAVELATSRLQAWGCTVRDFTDPALRHLRFGGTDTDRLAQLHAAAADSEVQIVLALRGGYGLSRLLPEIDFALLAGSGKLFVGHSDFTALQMGLLAQQGAGSFAGPMVCADFSRGEPSAFTMQQFRAGLQGPRHTLTFRTDCMQNLEVEGTLWGGNLAMLAHLAGTPYLPRIEDGILFIEDVNEHPYRIERMLLQLQHAGALCQQAILCGDFSGYRLSDYDNGYDLDTMFRYLQERFGIPVLRGLPFGHVPDKATLAVGSRARLLVRDGSATLAMSDYRSLADLG